MRLRRVILLIGLAASMASGASSTALALSQNGKLEALADSFPHAYDKQTETLVPYIKLDWNGKLRFNKKLRGQWSLFALTNPTAHGAPENLYADLPAAFIEWRTSSRLKLRAGMNTLNWAVVDFSSPSDVGNTTFTSHPLRSHKQGSPMLETSLGGDVFNLDLVYIPLRRRPEVPSQNSRWLPRSLLLDIEAEGQRIELPNQLEYRWDPAQTLGPALQHNAGAKLASNIGAVDLQATYFRGSAPTPKILPTQLEFDFNVARSPIHLTSYSYLVETTGMGFTWALENWIIRAESVYEDSISEHPLLQKWRWSNVLALETTVDLATRTANLLLQGYWAENPRESDNLISSSYRLFDRSVLAGGRLAWSDDLVLLLSSLYETETDGLFWLVGFEQKLTDQVRFGASWQDFSARREGLLKTFEKNDHATFTMTYFF